MSQISNPDEFAAAMSFIIILIDNNMDVIYDGVVILSDSLIRKLINDFKVTFGVQTPAVQEFEKGAMDMLPNWVQELKGNKSIKQLSDWIAAVLDRHDELIGQSCAPRHSPAPAHFLNKVSSPKLITKCSVMTPIVYIGLLSRWEESLLNLLHYF